MEVVINNCYGGFSLSPLAVKRLAELQGKPSYFFKTDFIGGKPKNIPLTEQEINSTERLLFFSAYTIPNPDEFGSKKEWHEMTDDERKKHNEEYDKISLTSRDINRNDKLLIQVVKELGEKADGACARLKIVEIPDDVDFEIDEYDGNEWVSEKHRRWS